MDDELKFLRINEALARIDRMNTQIEINTRKLNDAIKEMRGLVAYVRPLAKKNAWYGQELDTKAECIDQDAINPPKKEIKTEYRVYAPLIHD
jgi:hypothetical protein